MSKAKEERKNSVPSWVGPNEPKSLNLNRTVNKTIVDWQCNWESKFPVVVVCRRWDVEKVRTNKVMPIVKGKKKRRLRIEIRRPIQNTSLTHCDVEEGLLLSDWSEIIADGDIIVVKLMKKDKDSGDNASDGHVYSRKNSRSSSGSVSTIGFRGVEDEQPYDSEGWMVTDIFLISMMTIVKTENCKCTVVIKRGSWKDEELLYYFADYQTAKSLETFVSEMKALVLRKALNSVQTHGKDFTSTMKLSVEIVSATNLRALNGRQTDSYVIAYYGGNEVHRTSIIRNTCDPIWTVLSKSHFILTIRIEEIFSSELILEVKEYEMSPSGSTLGQAIIDNRTLLEANCQRIEFPLRKILSGQNAQGYLALRIRQVSDEDPTYVENFMKSDHHSKNIQAKYIRPPHPDLYIIKRRKKKVGNEKKHRARPPRDIDDEKWMSSEEIEKCAYEESESWVEAGSGQLGSLYLEIIGCDNLPNLGGVGLDSKSKADALAVMIFEDAIIGTDVVSDSFSPRFLPWTRRAFKVNIRHASSQIFLGVFEYDRVLQRANDPIGRCAISLEKFAPDTMYVLSYDIFKSIQEGTPSKHGSITIRLRIDWKTPRSGFHKSLRIPEMLQINMTDKKDFQTASFVIGGMKDVKKYSLRTILSHVDELQEYLSIISHVENALKTLLFWRGHYEVNICCCRLRLPLHSIILFTFTNLHIEYPELDLSLFFATIAWFMLALLDHQHKRPSRWSHSPSYSKMLLRLVLGMSHAVTVNQHEKECLHRMEVDRLNNRDSVADLLHEMDMLDELEASKGDVSDTKKSSSIDPLELYEVLHPWQIRLVDIIYDLRFARDILTWERTYLSFWITTIAILLSITFYILAYMKYILWVKRVIVWIFLGPWMMLVDKFYFTKYTTSGNECSENGVDRRKSQLLRAEKGRIQEEKERLVKRKAIREHLYGKHIISVPNVRISERFLYTPRTKSFAYPFNSTDKNMTSSRNYEQITGQSLSTPAKTSNFIDEGSVITFAESNPLMASPDHYRSLDE